MPLAPQARRGRRRRRTAAYGDADAQPGVPTAVWWRCVELLVARGEVDPWAERMARHATHHATTGGRLDRIEAEGGWIPGYKARYGLSRGTAYTDLDRLVTAGLLRQTRAACPGRTVAYQMCLPTRLPADLPAGLRAELYALWGRPKHQPPDPGQDHQEPAGRSGMSLVERQHWLARCQIVRYGSLTRPRPIDSLPFCGRLYTSPFLKRALSHPPRTGPPPPTASSSHRSMDQINDEESVIAEVMRRCRARWRHDRGPTGGLDEQAAMRLRPLVGGALRYLTSTDVIETMTVGTTSARDLGAVLATRLRGVIHAGRRARALRVDDDGELYAAAQARASAERATLHQATADQRRRVREELAAARARQARSHTPARPSHQPDPAPDAQQPPTAPAQAAETLDPAEEQALRWAMHNARQAQRSPHGQPRPVTEVLADHPFGEND